MTDERHEVVVIGAGQAGLAIGHFLGKQGRRFVILEAADSIASAWRSRWDSLVLFTPRRYDALPGLAFPGDPDGSPTRGYGPPSSTIKSASSTRSRAHPRPAWPHASPTPRSPLRSAET